MKNMSIVLVWSLLFLPTLQAEQLRLPGHVDIVTGQGVDDDQDPDLPMMPEWWIEHQEDAPRELNFSPKRGFLYRNTLGKVLALAKEANYWGYVISTAGVDLCGNEIEFDEDEWPSEFVNEEYEPILTAPLRSISCMVRSLKDFDDTGLGKCFHEVYGMPEDDE